jgi:octaprenyl-diphosphate synthase
MSEIDQIKGPVKHEMKEFNEFFRATMKSNVPLLDIIMNYILRRKGKQLRPLFVFLSAKMLGSINRSSYTAASLIELLHTATLIHDDVVDESYERRGFFSINALWKSKVAVLVGDYLLSKGLLVALDNGEYDILKIVSDAVKEISEGELYQIQKSKKLDIKEKEYFEIIRKKTATLIAACTASGARSVGCSDEVLDRMKMFGEWVGIAFQIRDDLFDYEKNGFVGKPMGNDIQEKKLTLPLIYALGQVGFSEKRHILHLVSRSRKRADHVADVIHFVKDHGGINYSIEIMNNYKDKALDVLSEFPDSDARHSLEQLVHYTINRKK